MEKTYSWQGLPETIGAGNIVSMLMYRERLIIACERGIFFVDPTNDKVTQIRFKSND